ncbi:methyl-accepting chemotaxis protein [Stutzerimonas tarimensis]|uniref:Methyl-accepting chemotaxis protein n=1 Tax=Stutzerimonas tarimensis TaxID=1507735 RepID=A0ABV7T494_9GAMM
MGSLKEGLNDLSVGKKLGLGFGLVLMLTLLVMLIGLGALSATAKRSENLNRVSDLDRQALAVRNLELRVIYDRDDQQVAALQQAVEAMDERIKALAEWLDGTEGQDALAGLQAEVHRYASALESLEQARALREEAQHTLQQNAEATALSLGSLQRQAFSALEFGDDLSGAMDHVRGLGQLDSQLQHSRQLAQSLLYRPDPEAAGLTAASLATVGATVERLRKSLPPSLGSQLFLIDGMLTNFSNALEALEQAMLDTASARQTLEASSEAVSRHSRALFDLERDSLAAGQRLANMQLGGLTAVALLLGALAAWLIARQITRPLQQTLSFAQAISTGDLSGEINSARRDELGQLQRAMQNMRQNLRELIGSIGDSATRIASAANGLSNITERASLGIASQKQETDQVATAVSQMAATVQEVARNAVTASEATQQAGQQAHDGDRAVNAMLQQIDRMAGQVSRSAQAMDGLHKHSESIGSVLAVIRSVAEQTNLLALNAAIEAARAGDAGRGFAVVADEVRGLAQRTQQSTREIQELIETLQSGAENAARTMQESRELSTATLDLARSANQALTTISGQVSLVQNMNQQIAAAAEEQSAVAEEISRSVVKVRDETERSVNDSEQTASSSIELARLGGELQRQVGRFRL